MEPLLGAGLSNFDRKKSQPGNTTGREKREGRFRQMELHMQRERGLVELAILNTLQLCMAEGEVNGEMGKGRVKTTIGTSCPGKVGTYVEGRGVRGKGRLGIILSKGMIIYQDGAVVSVENGFKTRKK